MKCCGLVELTQNIRIKIANAYREHRRRFASRLENVFHVE
jgi:hypothetical protein